MHWSCFGISDCADRALESVDNSVPLFKEIVAKAIWLSSVENADWATLGIFNRFTKAIGNWHFPTEIRSKIVQWGEGNDEDILRLLKKELFRGSWSRSLEQTAERGFHNSILKSFCWEREREREREKDVKQTKQLIDFRSPDEKNEKKFLFWRRLNKTYSSFSDSRF